MTKIYILLTLILVTTTSILSAQDVLWEKSLGGIHGDYLFDAQPTADYGFILAGSSLSGKDGNKQEKNEGELDYFIWKMDENGALEWQKNYGGEGSDLLKKILTTRDGGFLLAGTSTSNRSGLKKDDGHGLEDFWVIKLNADGSEQWQKSIGSIGSDELETVIEMDEGGFLLAGNSTSPRTIEKI